MQDGTEHAFAVAVADVQAFSELVRAYRRGMGWTQAEAAERWGYSFETVSAWERGKRFPSMVEVPRLARLIEIERGELAALVERSKGKPGARVRGAGELPAGGRVLWTLHLGVGSEGLQGVITCPLAGGAAWSVPLDAEASRQVHALIHTHLSRGGAQ